MRAIIFVVIMLLSSHLCAQEPQVRLFNVGGETWFSMNKIAAQNIISLANKGTYYETFVQLYDRTLSSVLDAKIESDKAQVELQRALAECRNLAIGSETERSKIAKQNIDLAFDNARLRRQRWYFAGGIVLVFILSSNL